VSRSHDEPVRLGVDGRELLDRHRDRIVALSVITFASEIDLRDGVKHLLAKLLDAPVDGAKQHLVLRSSQFSFCSGHEAPIVSRITPAGGKPYGSESPSVTFAIALSTSK
jgi:hypothetical protein